MLIYQKSNKILIKRTVVSTPRKKYEIKENERINRIYFNKNHVLGTQICEILEISTANVSNLKEGHIMKVGNCPILNKLDLELQPKLRKTMFHPDITSLENKMCLNYFKLEYNLKDSEILEHVADRIEIIAGKKFIVYKKEFLNKIKQHIDIDNILYTLDKDEFNELKHQKILKHYYKITDKKYLVIY
jgi:hypothetical protein